MIPTSAVVEVAGAGTVFGAVAVIDWRWRIRRTRELELAKAVGRNVGMTVAELDQMRHPAVFRQGGRMMKLLVQVPAHIVGDCADADRKTAVEAKMKATIRGVMGHVTIHWDPPRPKRHTGTITFTHTDPPSPVPTRVKASDLSGAGPLMLVFGVGENNRHVGWDIRPRNGGIPHALVYGATSSGKTETIQTIAHQAMDRGHEVYVIDPKADDFEEWKESGLCPVATSPDEIARMVAMVRRERERRIAKFRKHRRMAMLASGELKSIILVVDEMQQMLLSLNWKKAQPGQVMDDLLNIAQQGRAAGIHLLVGTQYPKVDAVGGGDFRNQFDLVIALGRLTTESKGLTGITRPLSAYVPGRAIVSWPGTEVEVQVGLSDPRVGPSAPGNTVGNVEAVTCGNAAETPAGTPLGNGSPIHDPVTAEEVAEIRRLRADGLSYGVIAGLVKRSRSVVWEKSRDVEIP